MMPSTLTFLTALLLQSAVAANPTFLVNGAGEARSCSSHMPFVGWCANSVLSTDRGWRPTDDDPSPWMKIELGASYLVTGLGMKRYGSCCGPAWAVSSYRIEVSADSVAWSDLGSFAGPTAASDVEAIVEAPFATTLRARYIKITPLEWDTVNGQKKIGLRVAVRLTFQDSFSGGYCSAHTGCPQGEKITYLGCYNQNPAKVDDKTAAPSMWVFGGGGRPAPSHTPQTCNTACLGYAFFALHGSGFCYCGDGGYDAFGVSTMCNQAHHFGNGLTSGCTLDAGYLCGGDALMVHNVRAPPVQSHNSPLVVGERRSTPLAGSDGRHESSWPTQCVTEQDVVIVRGKCSLIAQNMPWSARDAAVSPTECAGDYCKKILPRPDKTAVVSTYPATKADCSGLTCRHYRLQWLFSSELLTPARLIKLYGTNKPEGTKWLILPDLAIPAPDNAGSFDEMREADLWLEDLGDITNATYYLDVDGKYSMHQEFTFAFYPHLLRIASSDDNDLYYYEVSFSGQFGPIPNGFVPEDKRKHYENFVNPRAVVKHYKYYDLINPTTLCQSRGGCPFQKSSDLSDFEGYSRTVPSWIERKTFVLSNAVRNNARDGLVRYFRHDAEQATIQLTQKCGYSEEVAVTEGSHPKYLHLPTIELTRVKAWACAGFPSTTCSHGMPPQADLDRFGVPPGRDMWLLDQPDVWPFGSPTDAGWITPGLLAGASYFSYGDAVEQIGGPPYLSRTILQDKCGHFDGFFNPKRPMGSIAFYPRDSWQAADPLNEAGYSTGVQLQCGMASDVQSFELTGLGNRSLWATQPWNNVGLNTYQPIPSGVHLVMDGVPDGARGGSAYCWNCDRASRVLRFVAQYYDSSGLAPDAFEVMIDGTAHPMQLVVGKAHRGTYEYEHPTLGNSSSAPCQSYVFRARNQRGTFFLPQSGLYVFRTYGIGSCKEQWRSQTCTQRGVCRSSCGFPGTPCSVSKTVVPPSIGIQSGDSIFLKTRSGNGKHLDIEGSTVQARWESRGNWQQLLIEKDGGGSIQAGDTVFLKAHTGAHIDVTGVDVQARWNEKGAWQALRIQKTSGSGPILHDDLVCFMSSNTGTHLDVENILVQARWDDCGAWQSMRLEKEVTDGIFSGDSIHIQAHTGNRIEVEGSIVGARWGERGLWQTLSIENLGGRVLFSGDVVFLKAHTGKMLDVQGADVKARWDDRGSLQQFILERKDGVGAVKPGDQIFLKAHNGKMIDIEGDRVQARWHDHGEWQTLIVEPASVRRLAIDDLGTAALASVTGVTMGAIVAFMTLVLGATALTRLHSQRKNVSKPMCAYKVQPASDLCGALSVN